MKFIICLLLFIGLTGCGLKGSLYIPNEEESNIEQINEDSQELEVIKED
ncbi:MAG: lipoprotein [Ruminobacter sp.]|nr:lipoprotein [Ruminobacter sp.]